MSKYYDEQKIENQSWKDKQLIDYEYEYCTFTNCDFSGTSIISTSFIDCEFHNCNFSLTKLNDSTLNDTRFFNCKVLGIKFNLCNDFIFKVYFEECILDYCSFEKRKMVGTYFNQCSLKGVDFIETNLTKTEFKNCNLDEAVFIGTNLQEADFSSAYNYTINLQENFVRKTLFGKDGLHGLLKNYDIIIEDV